MKKTRATEHSQSWGGVIRNHHLLFCAILSLVVHLLVVIMFLALRRSPAIQVEEGFTVTLSPVKQSILKRESISHKPLSPTQSSKTLADGGSQRAPLRWYQDSEQPAILSTPLPPQSSSDNSPPIASMENTEGFGGMDGNIAEGRLGGGTGTGIRTPFISGETVINPTAHAGDLQSPMDKEKPMPAVTRIDSIDSDRVQSPTLTRNRSNQVDVVFVISCREEMRPYINDVVAFAKREIQQYQASSKDYRVGIITSDIEFLDGPQYIRYFPLNDQLNKALQVLNSIPFHPFRTDIQLNTIQYALERCAFRPDAQRRLIVFGNDIPICGGYSPLSVIEQCRELGVVLDIHGADTEVGALLASRTGGKWVWAFENRYDMETLKVPTWGNAYWKLQITLNDVVEQRIYVSE